MLDRYHSKREFRLPDTYHYSHKISLYSPPLVISDPCRDLRTGLSYHTDGEGRRSLSRSRSFKVTDFSTNRIRLPILVNDTDIDIPLRTLPLVTKLLFLTGVHLSNDFVLRNLYEDLRELFRQHSCRRHYRSIFNFFFFFFFFFFFLCLLLK